MNYYRDLFGKAWFVYPVNPWVVRGYQFSVGVSAGVFAFVHEHGRKLIGDSFRVVL